MAVLAAAPACAEDRDYCTDRPGISVSPCTMAKGAASLEVGLADWTLERDAQERQDTLLFADALLRYGIAEHAEVQLAWSSLGLVRTRDRGTDQIERRTRTGDVTLALRRSVSNPDGSGFSAAIMPFVTLPVGRDPVGAGDWAGGLVVPASYEVSNTWSVASTAIAQAAVDEDGRGRHFAFDEVIGVSANLSDTVTATAEYAITFDRDPQNHHVEHLSGLSFAWQPRRDMQLDLGATIGLDHDAPDAQVYIGASRRF